MHVNVIAPLPDSELVLIQQQSLVSRPVYNRDFAKVPTVFRSQHIDEGGAKCGKGKTAADKDHVFPFHLFKRIPIAQRASHSQDIAFFHVMQVCGHNTGLVHGKKQKSGFCGR